MTTKPLEGQFRIQGIEEAVRQLDALKRETGDVGKAAKEGGDGWGNLSQKITAGVVSVQAGIAAVRGLAEGLGTLAAEWERQAGIINRFTGNVDEAAKRTNGLISQIDLMAQQNKAAAAGLDVTSEQFATLAVRASEWAAATGGDATENFDRLMQAVSTGEEGPLKELGVSLEGLTTTTQRKEAALRQLTVGYEDATSEADSFGGMLSVVENRLSDVGTEVVGAIEDSGLLDEAFASLGRSVDTLIGDFAIFSDGTAGPLSDLEVFVITGVAMFTAMVEQIEAVINVLTEADTFLEALAEGNFQKINDSTRAIADNMERIGGDAFDDRVSTLQMQGMNSAAARAGTRDGKKLLVDTQGGPGAGGGGRDALGAAPGEGLAYDLQGELADMQVERMHAQEEAQQRLNDLAEEKRFLELEQVKAMQDQAEVTQRQKEIDAELYEQREAERKAQKKADEDREKAARTQGRLQRGAEEFAGLIQGTLELAAEGQENLGKSFVTMIDEWLKQFAIQEAYKGAAALAEGVGNAVMNTGHAAAKFAEAAQHFALAAVAGGVSAAIPNAGSSASAGGGASAGPSGSADSGGGSGGGTIVINYNAPVAEAMIGRQHARHQRVAERRFR